MKGNTILSRGSIGTHFGHKNGYHALLLNGFFSVLFKWSLKTLISQYVPQIKKKQPGSKWPLKAPCVGCRMVPGAKASVVPFIPDMSMLAPRTGATRLKARHNSVCLNEGSPRATTVKVYNCIQRSSRCLVYFCTMRSV